MDYEKLLKLSLNGDICEAQPCRMKDLCKCGKDVSWYKQCSKKKEVYVYMKMLMSNPDGTAVIEGGRVTADSTLC